MGVDSGRTETQPDEMEIDNTPSQLTTPSSTVCGKSAHMKKTTAAGVIDSSNPGKRTCYLMLLLIAAHTQYVRAAPDQHYLR